MNLKDFFIGLGRQVLQVIVVEGGPPDIAEGEDKDELDVVWYVWHQWEELSLTE